MARYSTWWRPELPHNEVPWSRARGLEAARSAGPPPLLPCIAPLNNRIDTKTRAPSLRFSVSKPKKLAGLVVCLLSSSRGVCVPVSVLLLTLVVGCHRRRLLVSTRLARSCPSHYTIPLQSQEGPFVLPFPPLPQSPSCHTITNSILLAFGSNPFSPAQRFIAQPDLISTILGKSSQ